MAAFKVAAAGTHSTGKSTFLAKVGEQLRAKGWRVGRVADLGSEAKKIGLPILSEHTFESTLWIMTAGIAREIEQSIENQVVLVDRPVVDALSYLFAALKYRSDRIEPWQAQYLLNLAQSHANSYGLSFVSVLDLGIPLAPGRDNDLRFRALVSDVQAELIVTLGLRVTAISNSENFVEDVVRKVEASLRQMGQERSFT